jgi:cytosine permease
LLVRRHWYLTIAPAYLGIFVWAPFFDSLWIADITRSRPAWLIASAVLGSTFCFVLLYWAPASWGLRTGRPLAIVAASTFGTIGSEWITGIGVAIANVVWYAVAIDYAVDATLIGLRTCGLIQVSNLSDWYLGSIAVKSAVCLGTALFWIYITGMAGLLKLTGVVAALMRIYAPIALMLLLGVALWLAPFLESFRTRDAAQIAENADPFVRGRGHASGFQLMMGYFALAGLASVGWGARVRQRSDLVAGGLAGIIVAASCTAAASMIAVAGTVGRLHRLGESSIGIVEESNPLSFRWAVSCGIGGVAGGVILILFGLAALAPACYSVWIYSESLSIHWPRLRQAGWTWLGGTVAFIMVATSSVRRLDLIMCAMGDVFAPAVGAMCGDWLRQRGRWSGMRPGISRPGVLAWGAGMAAALVLEVENAVNSRIVEWWQSPLAYGYFTSLAVYWLLASLVGERPAVTRSEQIASHTDRPRGT